MQYYWWALNEWQPLQREPLAAGVEKLSFPPMSSIRAAKRSPTWRRPAR